MLYRVHHKRHTADISLLNIIMVYIPILVIGAIIGAVVALRVIDAILTTNVIINKLGTNNVQLNN
jgi:hypothetical protein